MKKIDLHQVDAFSDTLFGGNPAGVVTQASELTEQDMMHIAREMNLSETAFVLPPTTQQADIRLRFFTPTAEVKFCGHATVATLFQLAELNKYQLGSEGKNTVRVETGAGILTMGVENDGTTPHISFIAPEVDLATYHLQGEAFAKQFAIPASALADKTIWHDRSLNYVYIPITSLEALGSLTFNFSRIRLRFDDEGVVVFCFYTNETKSDDSDLHARGLAPNVGVDEDPFTGSMQAGLVCAAKKNGFVQSSQKEVTTEQGHFIGRPGFAKVKEDAAGEVQVIAQAVGVFSTEMEIA